MKPKITRQEAEKICKDIAFDHPQMADVTTYDRIKAAVSPEMYDAICHDMRGQTCMMDMETNEALVYMCDIRRFFFGGVWD